MVWAWEPRPSGVDEDACATNDEEDKNNERKGAKRSQSQKFEKEERKRKEERRERKYITTLRLSRSAMQFVMLKR